MQQNTNYMILAGLSHCQRGQHPDKRGKKDILRLHLNGFVKVTL